MLSKEGLVVSFTDDAIKEIASISYEANLSLENIGARRLHAIIEKVIEDISFDAPTLENKNVVIDASFVKNKLKGLMEKTNLSKYLI